MNELVDSRLKFMNFFKKDNLQQYINPLYSMMLLLPIHISFIPQQICLFRPPQQSAGPYFLRQQLMFQTQIIKLSTLKSNLSTLLSSISAKYQPSKDYDVTVIVKETDTPHPHPSSGHSISENRKDSAVGFKKDNPLILNQDISESYISLDPSIDSRHAIQSQKTLGQRQPTQINHQASPPKLATKIRFKRKEDKENGGPEGSVKASIFTQTQNQQEQLLPGQTELKIDETPANSSRYSYKVNNLEIESENSDDDSEQAGSDGGFLIENHLNQALEFIETGRMEQLQDFLYKFKEKHSSINVRADAKWSLLMGYCKETKLEYERAATNYAQVVASLTINPSMLAVEMADIHCRLGRCYFQIGEWNKAINAYSQALNRYKQGKKCLDYANCITNLGVLYLQIGYFIQAERCFLMAFNIKRAEGDKRSKIGLLQTYFHLFDCNLSLRNMLQCEQILGNVGGIIDQSQSNVESILKVRFYIRCGKLLFFEGRFDLAQNHYHLALSLIKREELAVIEQAEALELVGVLKLEVGELQRSKFYLEKAHHCLQKCVPIESPKLDVLKKKIEGLNEALLKKNRQGTKHKLKTTMKLQRSNLEQSSYDEEENNSRSTHMVLRWKNDK